MPKSVADLWNEHKDYTQQIEDIKYTIDELRLHIQELEEHRGNILRQIEDEQGEIDWG